MIFPILADFQPYYSHCCCKKPDPGACPNAKTPCLNQQALKPQRRRRTRRLFSSPPPHPTPPHPTPPRLHQHLIVTFLFPQAANSSAWWTAAVPAPGEWRSLTRAPGAPSVMTAGTWTMPAWCAGSWAVEEPSMP